MFALTSALIVLTVTGLVLIGVTFGMRLPHRPLTVGALAIVGTYGAFCLVQPDVWWLANSALLLAAVAGGLLIARTLKSKAAVVAFCVTVGVVDFLSFSGGLTHHIIMLFEEGRSRLLLYLAVTIPFQGALRPIVGIGDLVVLGALFTALARLGYPHARSLLGPVTGLVAALVLGLMVGGISALPFIAGGTILYVMLDTPISSVAV